MASKNFKLEKRLVELIHEKKKLRAAISAKVGFQIDAFSMDKVSN